ncbi:bifunctional DNA primase/polymerase [uncultured Corynebacterium sp.]|uniref:bifunctional DNA primase/polymerase n=1 Tax=uncultured Corynebacterium sp. TaxID=159447 RepID=UPI00259149D4|nr:bifunctional DNA primase/polymerase [uncultured Corynebacterium sp.]
MNNVSISSLSNVSTIGLNQAIHIYLEKGFEPLPLPENEKYPPAKNTTGNIPALTKNQTLDVWQGRSETSNLAVRLPETLVGLDVDAHEGKTGAETLAALEARLGKLPETYTLSRHGADAASRHYYFAVPRNIKFNGQAGQNIEVIQATHRYGTAWPSEVDGQAYEWFSPSGSRIDLKDLPHVSEFPALPGAWLDELTKCPLAEARKYAPAQDFGSSEAMQWLARVAPGFAEPMPTAVEECVTKAIAEFEETGHDTALRETRHLIRWSVLEGQVGLKSALEQLREAFVLVVAARRGDHNSVENEFSNLVTDEVNTLRGQIEAGKATVYAATAGGQFIDKGLKIDITSMNGAKAVEAAFAKRSALVEKALRSSAPIAVPKLVAALCPELCTIQGTESDRLDNLVTGKPLKSNELREILNDVVQPEVTKVKARFNPDSDESKHLRAITSKLVSLYESSGLTALFENVANEVAALGRVMKQDEIDANPDLLGVGSTHVVDFALIRANPTGSLIEWVRPKAFADAVTKSLPLSFQELTDGLKSIEHLQGAEVKPESRKLNSEKLFEAVHPDSETREFVQTALGYSVFGSNLSHKFFVWFGSGGAGKGSVASCVRKALGHEYSSEIQPEQFVKGSAGKPDPKYAHSLTTRIAFVNEADSKMGIPASAIKRATEERSGRKLFSNNVVETDANTITFMTNKAFSFEHDSGVARRLAVIPFMQDRHVIDDVQPPETSRWRERLEERVWVLEWLLRGYVLATSAGKPLNVDNYPPQVAEATKAFVASADPSQEFFQRLERTGDHGDFVSMKSMRFAYRKETGAVHKDISDVQLGRVISQWFKDAGHAKDATRRAEEGRGFSGWVLLDSEFDDDEDDSVLRMRLQHTG